MAPREGLDLATKMEHLSIAFVRAIAATAGCNYVPPPERDDDSVDLGLHYYTDDSALGVRKSPRFDIQLKCFAFDLPSGATEFKYPLKRKNYDDLRSQKLAVPRILVVLLVPNDPANWLAHHANHKLEVFRCAYWLSLWGLPDPKKPKQRSVTVTVPTANQFTVSAVADFVDKIRNGANHL